MGHAVYTLSDPRAQILKTHAKSLAYKKGYDEEYEMLCSIERLAPQVFAEEKHGPKKVCANVDLFSGLIYRMLGISEDLYTPLFAISPCAGLVRPPRGGGRVCQPHHPPRLPVCRQAAGVCGAGGEIRLPFSRCSCKAPQASQARPAPRKARSLSGGLWPQRVSSHKWGGDRAKRRSEGLCPFPARSTLPSKFPCISPLFLV